MLPFGDLSSNLAAFCRWLREDHGFRIGPGEIQDAARALAVVGVGDERTVRDALRPILCSMQEDARQFDGAFSAFFLKDLDGVPQSSQPPLDNARARTQGRPPRGVGEPSLQDDEDGAASGRPGAGDQDGDENADAIPVGRAYSPLAGVAGEDRIALSRRAAWRDAARIFVRRLHVGLSRRWRPGSRGRRFDPRRTMRRSVQTGGEVLTPRWLHRLRRSPRLVVVVDGSRSMDRHAEKALEMAVGLASATPRLDVFTFSTEVGQVTSAVRDVARGKARRIERLNQTWGGGTRIGAALLRVLSAIERRPGSRDLVALVVSDGLDVGEPAILRHAMAGLARRAVAVIWLNPLLESPGYQPLAEGMRIARPYITTFASVDTPQDLVRLARRVHVRRG